MAVTVTNNVPETGQAPYRVTISPIRGGGEKLQLPYNPESWTVEYSQRWTSRHTSGARRPISDWEGNEPARVRWRILLTPRDYVKEGGVIDEGRRLEPERIAQQFETWAQDIDPATGEPAVLFLRFGLHAYPVVIESLPVNRVRTDPSGAAYQLELDVTFRVNPKF